MIGLTRAMRVFAYGAPVDLRKGFNGLSGLVVACKVRRMASRSMPPPSSSKVRYTKSASWAARMVMRPRAGLPRSARTGQAGDRCPVRGPNCDPVRVRGCAVARSAGGDRGTGGRRGLHPPRTARRRPTLNPLYAEHAPRVLCTLNPSAEPL